MNRRDTNDMYNKLTDRDLVEGLINNNPFIIKYFFDTKCSPMFRYIINTVFSGDVDYYELVSELYIYLQENDWHKVKQFDYKSKLTTWLSTVSVRFFIKKRNQLIGSVTQNAQIEEAVNKTTHERYDRFIENMDLYNAMNKLKPPRYRFVLYATEIEGREDREVAEMLGTGVSNIYNIKSRAKKQLLTILKEQKNVN